MKPHHHPRAASCMAALLGLSLLTASNAQAQNGTWINLVGGDASGSWAVAGNWAGSTIADGANNTANFSTLDLTTNSTVTLDGARTIGNLVFGDTTPGNDWVLNNGSAGPLTLEASAPTITVNNQMVTFGVQLSGTNGFTKLGGGIAVLANAANNFTGDITISEGALVGGGTVNNMLGTATADLTNNVVIVEDGATFALNANRQITTKRFFIGGNGVGGTNGAIYANLTGVANGTRILGATLRPLINLTNDTTIRIDGNSSGGSSANLLVDGFNFTTNENGGNSLTLTKTGTGKLTLDQAAAAANVGNGLIHVMEGWLGFRGNGINGGRSLTVDAGAFAEIGGDNNAINPNSGIVTINGTLVLNGRNDATGFNQQPNILLGSGTITSGQFGNTGNQTLTIGGSSPTNDSFFSGTIAAVSGTISVVKNQTNNLTLSGNNGYKGTTTVNAGALIVNGTHTGGAGYAVVAGATLGGAGTIGSTVTNAGTIAPTPGATFSVMGSIVPNISGTDLVDISGATLAVGGKAGTTADRVTSMILSNGTFQVPLDIAEASAAVSALNVEAASVLRITTAPPSIGQYPLISYNSLGGAVGFAGLTLETTPGVGAALSNNVANSTIDVVVTNLPAVVWAGNVNDDWDIGLTANWKTLGGSPVVYTEPGNPNNGAIFNDTGTPAVEVTTNVSPSGVLVNNTSVAYVFSGAGSIAGAAGLIKQGSGTLTVANSNTFTGSASIEQGTVNVGNGGTVGQLGSGPLLNASTLGINRSDDFTLGNTVSGDGNLTKAGAGTATVPFSGNSTGGVTVNAGTLQLGPAGTSTFSGNVTGTGAFGVNGAGRLILTGVGNNYSGGTVIGGGTLQFGDGFGAGAFPPAGNITTHGMLALALGGTLANAVSGSGGISVISNVNVTFTGTKTYTGPTVVSGNSGSVLNATDSSYSTGSVLTLGDPAAGTGFGSAFFAAGNPVLAGLNVGGNTTSPSVVNLGAGGQTLTINGNVNIGTALPAGASVFFQPSGAGVSIVVNTNGGSFQSGMSVAGANGNPDNVFVDFSGIDNLVANLGTNGTFTVGSRGGDTGPATLGVVHWFNLANVSNSITAGLLSVGPGGKGMIPELRLGNDTNVLHVNAIRVSDNSRDGGKINFLSGSGGVSLRAADGVSPAAVTVGFGGGTTGANKTSTVDLTGHPADLLMSALVLGNQNNQGFYQNTFSFDNGVLIAASTSLSPIRNNNANAALSGSTLNIGGGTASLGTVSLTASAAAGNLNITGGTVTVQSISATGAGIGTFNIGNATLNVDIQGFGNPVSAPVSVDALSLNGPVNLGVNAIGLSVGQFALIQYTGAIGGSGFPALNLVSLPAGVTATLSNNVANLSVDLVVTAAPVVVNPNPAPITFSVTGGSLNLSWPPDRLGWGLQSNSVSVVNASAWFLVPGSTTTTNVIITIDPTKPNVFYRMVYP